MIISQFQFSKKIFSNKLKSTNQKIKHLKDITTEKIKSYIKAQTKTKNLTKFFFKFSYKFFLNII